MASKKVAKAAQATMQAAQDEAKDEAKERTIAKRAQAIAATKRAAASVGN